MSATWTVLEADCIEAMQGMDEASVDAVVTDPPYGLEFMGKEWDGIGRNVGPGGKRRERDTAISPRGDGWQPGSVYGVPAKNPRCQKCSKLRFDHEGRRCSCEMPAFHARASEYGVAMQGWHEAWAVEAWRVLKPGAHLLAFGGTRTYHRLACALEDAGFEIRDCIAWMYGSGFPKSLDVAKAIDKAVGAERVKVPATGGLHNNQNLNDDGWSKIGSADPLMDGPVPVTPDAERWQGWGTALKPAFEPIVVARKPLAERNVAANVLEHGTGALNVDGCRVEADDKAKFPVGYERSQQVAYGQFPTITDDPNPAGRWPANVTLGHSPDCQIGADDGSTLDSGEPGTARAGDAGVRAGTPRRDRSGVGDRCTQDCAVRLLDEQTGETTSRVGQPRTGRNGDGWGMTATGTEYADTGGASRFLYVAKASREERNRGLEHLGVHDRGTVIGQLHEGTSAAGNTTGRYLPRANNHPTVKPVALMQWLVRLVTPPAGTVLDPFTGSGTTGIAALREGFTFIGVEREPEYAEIARARIVGDAPLFNIAAETRLSEDRGRES